VFIKKRKKKEKEKKKKNLKCDQLKHRNVNKQKENMQEN